MILEIISPLHTHSSLKDFTVLLYCTPFQRKIALYDRENISAFDFHIIHILEFLISMSLCVSCLLAWEEIGRMSNFTGEWPGPFWINQSSAAKSWKSDWLSSSLSGLHFHHLLPPASRPYQPTATFWPFSSLRKWLNIIFFVLFPPFLIGTTRWPSPKISAISCSSTNHFTLWSSFHPFPDPSILPSSYSVTLLIFTMVQLFCEEILWVHNQCHQHHSVVPQYLRCKCQHYDTTYILYM